MEYKKKNKNQKGFGKKWLMPMASAPANTI